MLLRKPKQFTVDGYTVTVDLDAWQRVRLFIPLMRAVEMTAGNSASVVFLVNHGTKDRPAYQPLTGFILNAAGVYVVLKDRTDPGDHRKANLRRA
jgi:hypothetical protein